MLGKRLAARVSLTVAVLAAVIGLGPYALTLAAQNSGSPTEFILRAPADRIAAVASRHRLKLVRRVDGHPDVYLVRRDSTSKSGSGSGTFSFGDTFETDEDVETELLTDPDVGHFETNGSATIAETKTGPRLSESTVVILDSFANRTLAGYFGTTVWSGYAAQPATGIMRLPEAQQLATGSGVVVAIIDTGVDPRHPALQGVLVPGYDFTRDIPGPASEWADLDESTVVILDSASKTILDPSAPVSLNESTVVILDQAAASTINPMLLPAAFGHGTMVAGLVHVVAPTAGIMPLKAFRADGTANLFDIERAIYYAVDHGAKVINMSFSMATASPEITHAIDYATAHGVICLASAGNEGKSTVVFPAGFRNVMGIGSTSTGDERSIFSNFGDHLVQFAAPGEMLITLYPGGRYASASGTSFSTALVSGGMGLLAQLEPDVDQRTAAREVDDGAVRRPGSEIGFGRINLFETLRAHAASTTTTTTNGPPAPADTNAPTVTLMSLTNGVTVTGVLPVGVSALDDVGVASVQLELDGVTLNAATSAPYGFTWDTVTAPNGVHVLSATARDAAGNQRTASVSVTVANDTTAPTVALTSPAAGATVTGTITISASASDDVGVTGVQFTLDGATLGTDPTAPYVRSWDSASVPNGVHVLGATAHDKAGNQKTASVSVTVANDTTAPAVAVTSPATGAAVAGTITVRVNASDDVAVAGVQFTLDGLNLGAERTSAPYEIAWNSGTVQNGVHLLAATARDAAGNQQTASVAVTVANDTTAPVVTLAGLVEGAIVSGTVPIAVNATDDVGVAGVQFTLDGVNLGAEHTASYTLAWDSVTVANGVHVLAATARDGAGNNHSASVSVTVANDTTAPVVTVISPANGAAVSGTITLGVSAIDDVGVAGVQFMLDGVNLSVERTAAPYEVTWNSGTVANGVHLLGATARDRAGNQHSASVTVTVANDTTPPVVTVTVPETGAPVTGTITLGVDASDDVGVAGVQMMLDGVNLGAERTAASFEVPWNSSTVANGVHVLAATARDAAGNQHTASVTVTVANDTTPPSVAVTSPADNSTVTGTVTLAAAASDDLDVVGVQFTLDGANLAGELTVAPFELVLDSATMPDGAHVLAAIARDAAGNQTIAAGVTLTVANAAPQP